MALTLAEALKGSNPKFYSGLIDEFRVSSYLLESMPFDDVAVANQNAWYYKYNRLTTMPTASTRAINSEGTPSDAVRTTYESKIAIVNHKWQMDRVLIDTTDSNYSSQIEKNLALGTKALIQEFNDLFINGDTGSDANAFDGLDVLLDGGTTEYNPTTETNLSNYQLMKDNAEAFDAMITEWLNELNGSPNALYMNRTMKTKLTNIAKILGKNSTSFIEVIEGRRSRIDLYDGIPLIDLGDAASGTIVKTETRDLGAGNITNLTDIYASVNDLTALHAITPNGTSALNVYLPNENQSNAVRYGEIELLISIALKATRGAGVFRNIKVA